MILHAAAVSSAEAASDPRRPGRSTSGPPETIAAWCREATGGSCSLQPIWSSTAPGAGIARTIRPRRSWDTAGPSSGSHDSSSMPARTHHRISLLLSPFRGGNPRLLPVRPDRPGPRQTSAFSGMNFGRRFDYGTAAEILVRLMDSETTGIVHVGGRERLDRFELMRRVAIVRGIDPERVDPYTTWRSPRAFLEPRPADVSLIRPASPRSFQALRAPKHRNGLDRPFVLIQGSRPSVFPHVEFLALLQSVWVEKRV